MVLQKGLAWALFILVLTELILGFVLFHKFSVLLPRPLSRLTTSYHPERLKQLAICQREFSDTQGLAATLLELLSMSTDCDVAVGGGANHI